MPLRSIRAAVPANYIGQCCNAELADLLLQIVGLFPN